jgi:hypothetical protein
VFIYWASHAADTNHTIRQDISGVLILGFVSHWSLNRVIVILNFNDAYSEQPPKKYVLGGD